ncbi:sld5 protein [Anaeramoeba ignava]|uniref:DNA replication complex GINS protein SLD5 n=1 Tax=Anaeramoeba ignava TaxID=1746090 RepID=A0A9Q0RG21_ANAIG|nr:sld5 protein [Anaeramoeba ignava]
MNLIPDLEKAWINEKNSPEIFPFNETLVNETQNQLNKQESFIFQQQSQNQTPTFILNLYETEIERIKFLLRSYLRIRLRKIEKFSSNIINDSQIQSLLSEKEFQFVQKFHNLIINHLDESFLSKLKRKKNFFQNKIDQPDFEEFVACQVLEDIENVQFEDQDLEDDDLKEGKLFIIKYKNIRSFVLEDKMKLL